MHEILKKIIEPRREFPNMLHGKLTPNRIEHAFRQKITTRQIINFLESHAHPRAKY